MAFYTPAEAARVLGVSRQTVLARIHLPRDHPRYLYALELSPRHYQIPSGALAQAAGYAARISSGTQPRGISED